METEPLFEERIDTLAGHGHVTVRVELGGEGAIQITFQGHDAPTVTYLFDAPNDALAIGEALVRAANIARTSGGVETG